ncbi:MAG: MFS transporter [Armatimonadetes bacterium]|nr:MFS transporter [Armatimonadota bacterium]
MTMAVIASSSAGHPRVRRQLWLMFSTVFLVMVGFGIVMPILPFFARSFGASSVQMGLLITVWALCQFVAAPFWGTAADLLGRKPVLVVGLVGYAIGFVAMAMAQSYAMLLGARILGGLLASSVIPAGQAIAADLSAPEERGAVMGQMGAGFGLGFLVGPALGGVLALAGPRVPFFAAAVASVLALPLVIWLVAEPPPDARRMAAARMGLAGIARALRSRELPLYLMAFAATFGGSSLFSMLGYYAIDQSAGSASDVGLMFTALGLGAVVTQGVFVGPVSRRWGEPLGIRLGFAAGAAGFIAVSLAASAWSIILTVGLASMGMALLRPSLVALNSRTTRLGYGTSLGMQTAFDSLGRTLGPLWAGAVYRIDMTAPFLAAAVIYLVAAAASVRLSGPR